MENTKVCPKCGATYSNMLKIEYCICGHKFESPLDNSRKVFKDLFGFDIREGLNKK